MFQNDVDAYLKRLVGTLERGEPSPRQAALLFDNFLAAAQAPPPDARLAPYFRNGSILSILAENLFESFRHDRRELLERITAENRFYPRTPYLKVRELSAYGQYPDHEVISRRASYRIHDFRPYLVTLNSPREDALWSPGSELSYSTRHEIRIATAIACTEYGGFAPYLSGRAHNLTLAALNHVDAADRVPFALEVATLQQEIARRKPRTQWRSHHDEALHHEFFDFGPYRRSARVFASRFLVSHPLLLRTGHHLVKATMLGQIDGLDEDSFAAWGFTLEGCLLLFQDAHGRRIDKLDRRFLRRFFADTYEAGEWMYEYVEEVLGWGGTRAQLIHPQLAMIEGWAPYMAADDWFSLRRFVKALLTYAVTGETFEYDFDLRPGS